MTEKISEIVVPLTTPSDTDRLEGSEDLGASNWRTVYVEMIRLLEYVQAKDAFQDVIPAATDTEMTMFDANGKLIRANFLAAQIALLTELATFDNSAPINTLSILAENQGLLRVVATLGQVNAKTLQLIVNDNGTGAIQAPNDAGGGGVKIQFGLGVISGTAFGPTLLLPPTEGDINIADLYQHDTPRWTLEAGGDDGMVPRKFGGVDGDFVWDYLRHIDLSERDTVSSHPISAITNLQDALDAKLTEVKGDTTPELGGELITLDKDVIVTDGSKVEMGRFGMLAAGDGLFLARTTFDEGYNPQDGGVALTSGKIELHGESVQIETFNGASTQYGRTLQITNAGALYTVNNSMPAWHISATGIGTWNFPTESLWVELTDVGPALVLPENIVPGEKIDFLATLFMTNTGNRIGELNVGWGINGAQPSTISPLTTELPSDMAAHVALSTSQDNLTMTAGDTLSLWVVRSALSSSQAVLGVDGSQGDPTYTSISLTTGTGTPAGGDVSSASNTIDNEIQSGVAGANKDIQGSGVFAGSGVLLVPGQATASALDVDAVSNVTMRMLLNGDPRWAFNSQIAADQNLLIGALNDAGAFISVALKLLYSGTVDIGTPVVSSDGATAGSLFVQGDIVANGGLEKVVAGVPRPAINTHENATFDVVLHKNVWSAVAGGGTFTPGTTIANNLIRFSDTVATTIGLMTEVTDVTMVVPDGLTLSLNVAYVEVGDVPTGRSARLTCSFDGTTAMAFWS